MALILSLETSTPVCTVALSKEGKTIALKESFEDKSHATLLTVFVEEILAENKLKVQDLDAVAVSEGPGSYTGLRIGVSVAKGLCYAAQKPLIAVDTLKTMVLMTAPQFEGQELLYCPMIDARRMEVYSELFDQQLQRKRKIIAEVIDESSYADLLQQHKIVFMGNGALKCQETIVSEQAVFLDGIYPSAAFMGQLAFAAYQQKDFKDVAYFEPFYLKDFVATTPKKKVL